MPPPPPLVSAPHPHPFPVGKTNMAQANNMGGGGGGGQWVQTFVWGVGAGGLVLRVRAQCQSHWSQLQPDDARGVHPAASAGRPHTQHPLGRLPTQPAVPVLPPFARSL